MTTKISNAKAAQEDRAQAAILALIQGRQTITFHWSGAIIVQYDGYEIVYLTPASNILIAQEETAECAVSLSGGLGSAIAGERALQRHGRSNIFYWFSDVLKEDPDLYRFLHALMKRWGGRFYYFVDGRRPEQVWEKANIIPNNRMCPCSHTLKTAHFRRFIKAMPRLPKVYIGYKSEETQRQRRTCGSYVKAFKVKDLVDYPLIWEPEETRELTDVCRLELGIEPPSIYAKAFGYNNCGGDCCKSGIGGRCLECIHFPERFEASARWEEMMQAKGGTLAGKTFCAVMVKGKKTPISLREIQARYVPLVRAYLEAHPDEVISEHTILRKAQSWQRLQVKRSGGTATKRRSRTGQRGTPHYV